MVVVIDLLRPEREGGGQRHRVAVGRAGSQYADDNIISPVNLDRVAQDGTICPKTIPKRETKDNNPILTRRFFLRKKIPAQEKR